MSVAMGWGGGVLCHTGAGVIIFYTSCHGDEGPLVINFIFIKARLLGPMVVCVCVCVSVCVYVNASTGCLCQ